jgi:hypothetical protein
MKSNLDILKTALQVIYGFVFLVLIIWIFPDIRGASKVLLDRAGSASSLEVVGFKVAFTEASVARGLALDNVPVEDQKSVLDAIRGLSAKQFIRLMAVGQLENLCEFDNPTPDMRNDVALDYDLEAKGLTRIEPSRPVLQSVQAWSVMALAKGKSVKIGAPRSCYTMMLTETGTRVKTVIVRNLAPAFNTLVPGGDTKVVAMNQQ